MIPPTTSRQRQPEGVSATGGSRPGFAHSPLQVYYEVTQACHGERQGCPAVPPHAGELTPRESLQLIDQLAEFPAPPMLMLTGGDPLARADLFELIEHGVALRLDVSLTARATPFVTRRAVGRLRDAGLSRLAIRINGKDAAAHDAACGAPGSFDHALRILTSAREAGLPVQVDSAITPANSDQLDAMAELMAQLEVDTWSVYFQVPLGRAAFVPRLSAAEYELAFQRLWRQARRQAYAIRTSAAPQYRRYVIRHQMSKASRREKHASPFGFVPLGINDGRGVMFVSHVGLIHPSGLMPIVCGMFPLCHVAHVYQNSPVFRGLRDSDRLEGKCRLCEFRHLCGGSRARAYAVTGNPFAQEPDCDYVPAAMLAAARVGR